MYFTGFDCLGCRATYPPDQDLLLCPDCHQLLEARYDLARFGREVDRDALVRRPVGVWRWRELLPVLDYSRIVTLGEGGTPFLRSERLARLCGVRELWLKSDAANPTGSLKDRSITVSATKAVEALCGERFVPQRDPKKLPMCQVCKEIYGLYRMGNEGLSETPSA